MSDANFLEVPIRAEKENTKIVTNEQNSSLVGAVNNWRKISRKWANGRPRDI